MTPRTMNRTSDPGGAVRRRRITPQRVVLYAFLTSMAIAWLMPLAWAVFTSFRTFEETARIGYFSWPQELTLQNYADAFTRGDLMRLFFNTLVIIIPALLITLTLASMAAFVLSRFSFRGNLAMLLLFTAGNLLPPQVIITPLLNVFRVIPLPDFMNESGTLVDSYWAVGLVQVGFQVGFVVFVLSNFMKLLPVELTEAAQVDGASVWQQFWKVILPLCRPALAAVGTLEFTWMYNDFLWALVLMVSGNKRPITSALDILKGAYFTDFNLIAAASIIIALPTIIVYFVLQRQFVGGLTVGATKG